MIIVRREHRAHFTIVPNAVFADTRLSVEAKGVLGYLLSRPHNRGIGIPDCAAGRCSRRAAGALSSFRRHGLHNGAFCGERKMPWKACKPMDERLKFIARLLDGDATGPRAPRSLDPSNRMSCGVLTTRASSCSPTDDIAIR